MIRVQCAPATTHCHGHWNMDIRQERVCTAGCDIQTYPQSCVIWETCVSKECGRYALQKLLGSLFKQILLNCSLISDKGVIPRPTTRLEATQELQSDSRKLWIRSIPTALKGCSPSGMRHHSQHPGVSTVSRALFMHFLCVLRHLTPLLGRHH